MSRAVLGQSFDKREVAAIQGALYTRSLFWFEAGNERTHLPSALVRWFKDRRYERAGSTDFSAVTGAFAEAVISVLPGSVDFVIPMLESRTGQSSPLAALAANIARMTGAKSCQPFRRTSDRPSMSSLSYLSGSEAFEARCRFVSQDIIFEGDFSNKPVLIVDDIRCTGASECVWAWALRSFGGAAGVYSVNLAQMNGMPGVNLVVENGTEALKVNIAQKAPDFAAEVGWEPSSGVCHLDSNCPKLSAHSRIPWIKGLIPPEAEECPECRPLKSRLMDLLRSMLKG